ncbi:hypothetical protein JCM10213_000673 [Rhodosporidiobolus nylandii]
MATSEELRIVQAIQHDTGLSMGDVLELFAIGISPPPFGVSADDALVHNTCRQELLEWLRTTEDDQLADGLARLLVGAETGEDDASEDEGMVGDEEEEDQPAVACLTCGDDDVPLLGLACDHSYCHDCLRRLFRRLFRLATLQEEHNPASCCDQQVEDSHMKTIHLRSRERKAYRAACREFAVKNRLYCSKKCSIFLCEAGQGGEAVTCPKCSSRTCPNCKSPQHSSKVACAIDPDDDAATKLVLQLDNGGRCESCLRVIEKIDGCSHVTCICGQEMSIGYDDYDD